MNPEQEITRALDGMVAIAFALAVFAFAGWALAVYVIAAR